MYLMSDHLSGNLYWIDDYELEESMMPCEECGDSDWPIGFVEDKKRAGKLLGKQLSGYTKDYIQDEVKQFHEVWGD